MDSWILTIITFVPLVGALALVFIPKDKHGAIKWTSLLFSLVPLVLSVMLWIGYDPSKAGMQYEIKV
ncbi:MAG: Fe-S-binding domain-containing protein, partial [Armatimonadota bacterium]|nr:Fe-S-binding domain-containing protein [Armatimonadota bacterium]